VGNAQALILGIDFTCAPRPAKAITVAFARWDRQALAVDRIDRLTDFAAFEALLARPGPWIGGFDFPFGMPAELIRDLGWPREWRALVQHCKAMTRLEFRAALDAYRATRPAGRKYAHRATDFPAGSSSPMKLVNPPVALMFHEGARRLAAAGVHVPMLAPGDRSRIALEAYPGLLARSIVRSSYKSDTRSKQTPERAAARMRILMALRSGEHRLGVPVRFSPRRLQRDVASDSAGDLLDAVLCAVQAAWASRKPQFGMPRGVARCEGWIVSA
jgi:uncharacterized protein DUF429